MAVQGRDRPLGRICRESVLAELATLVGRRPEIGQSGRWARPVPATAMLQSTVACIIKATRGCFQCQRTAPVDPEQPFSVASTQCPAGAEVEPYSSEEVILDHSERPDDRASSTPRCAILGGARSLHNLIDASYANPFSNSLDYKNRAQAYAQHQEMINVKFRTSGKGS